MKINFKKIEAQTSFEGAKQTFDVAETVGNEMMYNGSILLDIGFEDLARGNLLLERCGGNPGTVLQGS